MLCNLWQSSWMCYCFGVSFCCDHPCPCQKDCSSLFSCEFLEISWSCVFLFLVYVFSGILYFDFVCPCRSVLCHILLICFRCSFNTLDFVCRSGFNSYIVFCFVASRGRLSFLPLSCVLYLGYLVLCRYIPWCWLRNSSSLLFSFLVSVSYVLAPFVIMHVSRIYQMVSISIALKFSSSIIYSVVCRAASVFFSSPFWQF